MIQIMDVSPNKNGDADRSNVGRVMAIMYPRRLSDRVLKDRKLKGEIETYNALSKLPDEFEVFYNRCVNAREGSKAFKRPIDFIVLHEKLGLLAIEVKGGKIRIGHDGSIEQYHPSTKKWASIDPYEQVKNAAIELINTCKADGVSHWIPDDICVVFPNTLRRDITDIPHILPNGTLCADDLLILPTQIRTLFSKPKRELAWSRDAFLDMRRRLQNMPEAQRSLRKPEKATFQKRFYNALPKIKTSAQRPKETLEKQNEAIEENTYYESEDVEENIAKLFSARRHSDTDPSVYVRPSFVPPQHVPMQWWHIVAAIVLGALAVIIWAWCTQNPYLHKLI